jgi:hypothetical protein
MAGSTRKLLGVLLRDVPVYVPALLRGGDAYLTIRNRHERLSAAPQGAGFRCEWQWASDLHAPKVMPLLGRELMRRALAVHPVRLADAMAAPKTTAPEICFVIGHRGVDRLPHLLSTLRTIAAQERVGVECIVVEQDAVSRLTGQLPSWVRLIHTPPPTPEMPYCRSWTFNVAARQACAPILVLHDNDMLVPVDYAAHIVSLARAGYEVMNPKRFIFYLSHGHTEAYLAGRSGLLGAPPEVIVQNLEAGGSVAITREAFERIGGMDESFIGWGGEDNEFWERAATLQVWTWGSLPIVHLWHAAQIGKQDSENQTAQHYRALAHITPLDRIRRLRHTARGQSSGPAGVRP